jgi:hypothetical protein
MDSRVAPAESRRLLVAVVLLVPSAVFVTANVLQYWLGIDGAAEWIDPLFQIDPIGWLATALILLGPVVTFLIAAARLLPIKVERDEDTWKIQLRVRIEPRAIALTAASLVFGGILLGHLVAENLPCLAGLRSSC